MRKYVIRRILVGIIVLVGVITITFIITKAVPSDPATKWAGLKASPEALAKARKDLGLDKPILVQYINYVKKLLKGDLGRSFRTKQPVTQEILERIPATLEIVLFGFSLAIIMGIPLGIYSAKYKNKILDHVSRVFSVSCVSLPSFWVALIFQLFFYARLGLLPLGGRLGIETALFYDVPHITGMLLLDSFITGNFMIFKEAFLHLLLPSITIGLFPMGLIARMTRSALLEILNEDYITSMRSYGISESKILWKYAVKNSLGPTVTVVALSFAFTVVNTFLVEIIFSWPGLGSYISKAITTLDHPVIIGIALFSAVLFIMVNLIADLVIALDPRVKL